MILGILNLIFSFLIVFFFLIKKAPLLIDDYWNQLKLDMRKKKKNFFLLFYYFIVFLMKISLKFLSNFEFIYYMIYMIMNVSSLAIHPFLFAFNLSDFLNIDILKSMLQAIWIPKGQLFLTFTAFLLIEYYFTISAFLTSINELYGGTCDTLWICFLTTFDQTFKVKFSYF
jgi:hypothetical protein